MAFAVFWHTVRCICEICTRMCCGTVYDAYSLRCGRQRRAVFSRLLMQQASLVGFVHATPSLAPGLSQLDRHLLYKDVTPHPHLSRMKMLCISCAHVDLLASWKVSQGRWVVCIMY